MALSSTYKQPTEATMARQSARAYTFLREHPVGVLATVDPNGDPHAVTIYFGIDEDLSIIFITKANTKKHDNLIRNNHAMLVAFDEAKQTSVQVTGLALPVSSRDEQTRAFRSCLRASLHTGKSAVPPVAKVAAGAFTAWRLQPTQIRLNAYAHPDVRGPGKMFEVIDIAL